MKVFWITMISFCLLCTGICFWYMVRIEQQADILFDQKMDSVYNQKITSKTKDTGYCIFKCRETGLICILDKNGKIIDTFTQVPVFDSLLLNHSKIP